MEPRPASGNAWQARPAIARGLRLSTTLIPILVSVGLTSILRWLVPAPGGATASVAWAAGLIVFAVATAVGVERLARRLLPLVTLLNLSMVFPDRAPSRFSVARSAGSVRKLEARLAEAEGEESRSASTILSLAVALQSHDRHTRGHAERVRVYTDLLGEELQLPELDRHRLRWAALLHDIGKLKISARILNKPGALDDKEWVLMKRHPSEGARIAAPLLEWLGPWGDAIVEHHERYDGKGYPAGHNGSSISLAGRIVAVADCYDTMTAARSYKKPMAVWAARRELADCAGGQFDPEIVRAFLSISLPKLLWKTGPLSFFVQLPFLYRLQEVGLRSVEAMTQGAAVATVAAGVTAIAAAGPVGPVTHTHRFDHPSGGAATAVVVVSPGASTNEPVDSPAPSVPTTEPTPQEDPTTPIPDDPSPTTTPSPRPTPTPRPTTTPSPAPSPSPAPLPTPTPRPPVPSVPPLPIPSIPPLPVPSVPPLPIPSVPPLPIPSVPPLPFPRPLSQPGSTPTDPDTELPSTDQRPA